MRRILVTGGAGFIGSHTCLLLLEKGYELFVIDSYVNSSKHSLGQVRDISKNINPSYEKNIHVFEGDLRDHEFLEKVFINAQDSDLPIQGVIHFAGLKSVVESVKFPLKYWDANVNSSINLLKVMEAHNCRVIVFSSSATIYGLSNNYFLREEDEIKPINPYGNTKAAVEQILNDTYNSSKNWRIANLRYFNPIGAHPSGLIGENPLKKIPNNIFPYITQVASNNISQLNVFGNDWPTPDGTGVRDYIHVMDLAEGHLMALEYLEKEDPKVLNLNLGTGRGTSVLELVETFERVNNLKIPYSYTNRREGDAARLVADNSLASSLLGWTPKKTLEDMCLDGWKWQSLNINGYQ